MNHEFIKNLTSSRLFDEQGSFSWPIGYNNEVAEFISWLDDYEKKTKCKVKIVQVKMKFGYLTIYIDMPQRLDESREHADAIHDKINQLTKATQALCSVCGKALVETVYDSKIVHACFEHMRESYVQWSRR